jgi:hypothetical protein
MSPMTAVARIAAPPAFILSDQLECKEERSRGKDIPFSCKTRDLAAAASSSAVLPTLISFDEVGSPRMCACLSGALT